MIYSDFQGLKLSQLGMGTMRLPLDDSKKPDEKAVCEMVDYALAHGVNYFDTAWGYHEGLSETVVGKALSRYPRESFYLADKFPGYDLSNMDKVGEIFEKQLEKTQTEYFDFYLFHNVCEMNIDEYLNEKHGIFEYLYKQKQNGRIRHLGCSMHGDLPVMKRFLEKYGKYMEFCQLQINYLDWHFQNAEKKVGLLREYGIPVWVMEPLRGGKLVSFKGDFAEKIRAVRPGASLQDIAFRFLQGIGDVKVILSGMSDFAQLSDNIEIFSESKPLSERENAALLSVAHEIAAEKSVPCTGCRYCVSKCRQELDIPELMALYNENKLSDGGFLAAMRISSLPKYRRPTACIACTACEKVCPQGIKIHEIMAEMAKSIKPF